MGDVLAESRGAKEDRELKEAYGAAYGLGTRDVSAGSFQSVLSSKQLKLDKKSADRCGLQLGDLLAHTCKQAVLVEKGGSTGPLTGFGKRLWEVVAPKCHPKDGRVLIS